MALMKINAVCRVCSVEFHQSPFKLRKTKAQYCGNDCYRGRGTTRVPECHPDRPYKAFGKCEACYAAGYFRKNRKKYQNWKREYRSKNPKRTLDEYLKYEYGISSEQWEALLKKQNNSCAICGGPPTAPKHRLTVDHDHATGRVRGLLCGHCNKGLGSFMDKIENLEKAVGYLKEYGSI